jgi:aldehyde dehydrogenase (NAD+)
MCCSSSRIFVHSAIYDSFLEKFTLAARAMKVGDPFAPGTKQGPVVSSVQYERILSYIKSGISEGATLHLGGTQGAAGGNGYFIPPTIFTDVKPSMRIVKEEIFGPVCVLAKFKSQDDIVELANEGMYGLGAAVFCKDVKKALNLAHAMKAGTVWVNMCNVPNAAVPFGGYKMSGIGRELGEEALAK